MTKDCRFAWRCTSKSIADYLFCISTTAIEAAGSTQVMETLVRISDRVHTQIDRRYVPYVPRYQMTPIGVSVRRGLKLGFESSRKQCIGARRIKISRKRLFEKS